MPQKTPVPCVGLFHVLYLTGIFGSEELKDGRYSYRDGPAWFEPTSEDLLAYKNDKFQILATERCYPLDEKEYEELEDSVEYGGNLLHAAIKFGSRECLQKLLNRGLPVNAKNLKGFSPMRMAVLKGDIQAIQILSEHGADLFEVNGICSSRTLLHDAAIAGMNVVVSWMVGRGLQLNAKECDGWEPIHWAGYYGRASTIETMARLGAEVNAISDFMSQPLHWAAGQGHREAVYKLIQLGATVNSADIDGWTPLQRAVLYGHLDIVQVLIDSAADIHVRKADNKTALNLAKEMGYSQIETYLFSVGASEDLPELHELL